MSLGTELDAATRLPANALAHESASAFATVARPAVTRADGRAWPWLVAAVALVIATFAAVATFSAPAEQAAPVATASLSLHN